MTPEKEALKSRVQRLEARLNARRERLLSSLFCCLPRSIPDRLKKARGLTSLGEAQQELFRLRMELGR